MGSVARVFKKATKAVTKPISKAFKGVAKGILKVGKATMRGIAKINKKLGPLGSIALAIAMPYALGGLSSGVTALQKSQYTFLKSIGNIGNQIRTGYQAFNTGVSKTFSSITKSIAKSFNRFAPKSVKDTFSGISQGAKNLFNSAKKITKKYSPIKGKQGTVQVSDGLDQVYTLTSKEAEKQLAAGTLEASQLGQQTLGSQRWFVQGSTEADKIITETINDAYKSTYNTFSPNAQTYFNDLKRRATDINTYVNDAEIGGAVENSIAASKSATSDGLNVIDIDFAKTKDYVEVPNGGYKFTGDKTFSPEPVKQASNDLTKAFKKSATGFLKSSLLKPSEKIDPYYIAPTQDMTMQTTTAGYGGTDITGTAGGDFITKVYGLDAANRIKNYYKNMNLISSYSDL